MNTETDNELPAKPTRREPIAVGERGLRLTDMDQMFRFAKAVSTSKFCPPGFSEVDVFIALQKGSEVGFSPMQALESIYVVNNRATLYGDAPKALCEVSGLMEDYEQRYEGEGDQLRAIVTSKRRGRKPMTETFSVADAKAAELWGKKGPWTQYPKRMLMFRARGYNLRDNFGDCLKGFQIGELVDDEAQAGFEHARQAKVVEPNFHAAGAAPPAPVSNKLKREASAPAPNSEQPRVQVEAPPTEAPPAPKPADEPPRRGPGRPPKAPPRPRDLFEEEHAQRPQPVPVEPDIQMTPAADVMRRLEADKLDLAEFIQVMVQNEFMQAGGTLADVSQEDLETALAQWPQIVAHLRGYAK